MSFSPADRSTTPAMQDATIRLASFEL